jgi:hypothetical protein
MLGPVGYAGQLSDVKFCKACKNSGELVCQSRSVRRNRPGDCPMICMK